MKSVLISGPPPDMQGGPAAFVRTLTRILRPHYAITNSTRENLAATLLHSFSGYSAIILNSSNLFPLLILTKNLLSRNAAKTLLIMHGEMGKELPYGIKKLLLRMAQKIYLRKADHIVFLSRMFMNDFLESNGEIFRKKSVVIPYGIEPIAASGKINTPSLYINMVYVGGRRSEKGRELIDEFLADQTLPTDAQIQLTILRATENADYRASEKVFVSERKTLPEQDFLAVLAQADIYLSASKYETFGIALLQAYFSGCKLVAFEKAGALENLTDRRNIYVFTKHNYQDFRNALCRAIASPTYPLPNLETGVFSLERMAERYCELIEGNYE